STIWKRAGCEELRPSMSTPVRGNEPPSDAPNLLPSPWRRAFFQQPFKTTKGKQALADLEARNGTGADGTPIIRTTSEIDNLLQNGFLKLIKRADDGSEGFPWVVCSIYEDPTQGAITSDAFLVLVPRDDGTPVSQEHQDNFGCLQGSGDFCS
ncbi:MAG TPA: hypothetical protein VGR37_11360, partial [Longimicrobiaceae bacterium]|nr:hypothetical protein [Longimicrobiaceae bacterium]